MKNGSTVKHRLETPVVLMGVKLTHLTMLGALGRIAERIAKRQYIEPVTVFTPNTEQMIQTKEDKSFLEALNMADITIPDSVGLVAADWWRAALTGKSWTVRERVTGVDLAENLLLAASKQGWRVVLVGGMDNLAQAAVDHLKKRFEGLQIWWAPSSMEVENETGVEFREVVKVLDQVKPDLLLVGFGAPKQEVWVLRHKNELATQVVMVVGGAIDMWAGKTKRAPDWMQRLGLEWMWRLGSEPSRWRRQIRLVKFLGQVLIGK